MLTILIVDYDADRKALVNHYRRHPDLIYLHSRPTRALETLYELYADGECIDAAIIDLELPIMSGIELTQKIREMEKIRGANRRIPIFWFTAFTFDPENPKNYVTSQMRELEIVKVFHKPEDIIAVVEEVKGYVEREGLKCSQR